MIGLSLSLCVKDIISGKEKLNDVEYIISGIKCANEREYQEVLDEYAKTYWNDDPEHGKQIAMYLWNEQKIIQPRWMDMDPPMIHPKLGKWRR